MQQTPTISVIINCYNSEQYLCEALDSVYTQTFSDWEIIFFDNNSTDGSAKIAQLHASHQDGKLKYIKNDKTVLLGEARNLAVAQASGQYVAFLDCDDLWLPEKLEKQLAQLQQPSSRPWGMCFTDAMRVDAQGHDLLSYSHEKKPHSGNVYQQLLYYPFIACSACMVDTAVLRASGGFDPSFHYVEEWDVWLKVAKNRDVAFVDQELTKIRIHSSNVSRDLTSQYQERLRLAEVVMQRDSQARKICKKAMKMVHIQYKISSLLLAENLKQRLSLGLELLFKMLMAPLISLSIMRKYLNLSVYRAFRKKYMSRETCLAKE